MGFNMGIKNIAKSLMEFQKEIPIINKNKKGYNYNYADLPNVIKIITPLLIKNGLIITQLISNDDNGCVSVHTILIHVESGEVLETTITHPLLENKGKSTLIQTAGSVITYLRRYSLSSMLGIVTDEDVDGNNKKPPNEIFINKTQIDKICDLMGTAKIVSAEEFYKYLTDKLKYNIYKIESIQSKDFNFVSKWLELRIEKQENAQKEAVKVAENV
jgi:hypothetical protein